MTLKELSGPVVLMGAGKMGGAMLDGWLTLGLPAYQAVVLDPHLPDEASSALRQRGVRVNPDLHALETPSVVVLAVKPQVAPQALPAIRELAGPGTLVLSIMAGRPLSFLESHFAPGVAIARVMPNTPAAIGQGVSVAVGNKAVSAPVRELATALLSAVGMVEWVEDEGLIDAVTAVSGSGPAYVFLLAEALAQAGVKAGLPADLSGRIARATVSGSGALLAQSDLEAATLRQNVTSPGGTTAAALAVLMDEGRGFGPLLEDAIAAAALRSRELAG